MADARGYLLLVEDDPDFRQATREVLERCGFNVVCAENGLVALQHLQAHTPPILIILDLMMPVMDGWHFQEELARDSRLAKIPVVIVSGSLDGRRQKPKAIDHLRKPFDFDELLAIVRRLWV